MDISSSTKKSQVAFGVVILGLLLVSGMAEASTTGAAFEKFYTFIYDAATGYLGRGIAIAGGLIGLGYGAIGGKFLIAGLGIALGMFGTFGPQVVNALFTSAIV